MADSSALQTSTALRTAQYVQTVSAPGSSVAVRYAPQTAREKERAKTRQEKAEDVIYTLNHSITCLSITDAFLQGVIVDFVNRYLHTKIGAHEHEHGYSASEWMKDRFFKKHNDPAYIASVDHKEDHRIKHVRHHIEEDIKAGKIPHPDPSPKLTPKDGLGKAASKLWYTSSQWLMAEAVGDIGAVPFTIFIQRHAPGFMQHLRNGIESTVGGLFRWRTQGSAVSWGKKHGFEADSQEVKDRQHELYEYEISHMPQMAVWTVSSVLLNFGAMHAFHHMDPRRFEKTSAMKFLEVKGIGAAMTAGLVVGLRGITPNGAHWWDRTMGKYVVIPFAKMLGVGKEDADAFEKKREMIETGAHHLAKKESSPDTQLPDNARLAVNEKGQLVDVKSTLPTPDMPPMATVQTPAMPPQKLAASPEMRAEAI